MQSNTRRGRKFGFQRNYEFDTHDKSGALTRALTASEWVSEVQATLEKSGHDEIFWIVHDKDVLDFESKEKKGTHIHGLILDKNPRHSDAVKLSVGIDPLTDPYNHQVQVVRNSPAFYRYLTHISTQALQSGHKHIYDISELHLIVDGKTITAPEVIRATYMERIKGKEKTETDELPQAVKTLIAQVADGQITKKEAGETLASKFKDNGLAEFVMKGASFDRAQELANENRAEKLKEEGKDLTTAYVFGPSESGKTLWTESFTRYIAKQEKLEYSDIYTAPSSNASNSAYYMLSDYRFQRILVADDLAPEKIPFDSFLKIYDPKKVNLISDRYKNHNCYATRAFIVKSESPRAFFKAIYEPELSRTFNVDADNTIKQVMRRIHFTIEITTEAITISKNCNGNFLEVKRFNIPLDERKKIKSPKVEKMNAEIYEIMYGKK